MKVLKIRSYFFKKEAEKEVFHKKRFFLVVGVFFLISVFFLLLLKSKKDTSSLLNSDRELIDEKPKTNLTINLGSKKISGLLEESEKIEQSTSKSISKKEEPRNRIKIEYKATQVIERKKEDLLSNSLPLGTNLVGTLLTSIDTRETNQLYKVLLPYGGEDKNGGTIPKNSVLFGNIQYSGKGKKLFMQFSKALLPDGNEVSISAQALNSKDYSPGLEGEYHGMATERIISSVGLGMVSAMTDTLTEKEALGTGEFNAPTPKANLKNAFYQGISKGSESESQRQLSEIGSEKEYLTIPAGKEMIISLLSTYYEP